MFVYQNLWSQTQLEDYICEFGPVGVSPDYLQGLPGHPLLEGMDYMAILATLALRLLLGGHQRDVGHVLKEIGLLPDLPTPPALQVMCLDFLL